jgi:hypothetical protein
MFCHSFNILGLKLKRIRINVGDPYSGQMRVGIKLKWIMSLAHYAKLAYIFKSHSIGILEISRRNGDESI